MTLHLNRILNPLIGILLLGVFSLRPCAALVREMNQLRDSFPVEKHVDEPAKECKDAKDGKGQLKAEYRIPESGPGPALHYSAQAGRPRILHEVLGCPGPILQILTPPPDGSRR